MNIMRSWWDLLTFMSVISSFYITCYSNKAPKYSFMKSATNAPKIAYYDYIVVGGGTAGCALAATLSEGAHVLLLERGGAPYGNTVIEDITGFGTNLADTTPTSTAQPFTSTDGVPNARARVLGGGSAINAGFYTRASSGYVSQAGWDTTLVNESYEWVEKKVAFRPPMLEFQSAFKDGLIEVGIKPYNGFTYDHIYGTKIGGTIFDDKGKRHTAADLLEYAVGDHITVYLNAVVHKILFQYKGKYSQKPRANGVTYIDSDGKKHKAYLKQGEENEIILSAGAIGSPQLLMLSGIGPSEHLRQLGIRLVMDQPMVGQGMADNPMNAVVIPSPNPVEVSLIQAVGITRFGSYIEAASSTTFANAIIHSLPTSSQNNQPSSNSKDKYLRSQFRQMSSHQDISSDSSDGNDTYMASLILEKTIGPKSTGHLHLNNKNPNDNPSVTFNYFKNNQDLTRCVRGMETIIKIIESRSFSKFRYPDVTTLDLLNTMLSLPLNQCPRKSNDTEYTNMAQFCRDTVMTIWHYHGGCQVGRVVDEDYKVFNVSRLRVIDGSTLYDSPGTNPQATVMMLGRYMGQKIIASRHATASTTE